MSKQPDFDRLRAISNEARQLIRENRWTKVAYLKLAAQADEVANDGDATEFLALLAEPEWTREEVSWKDAPMITTCESGPRTVREPRRTNSGR